VREVVAIIKGGLVCAAGHADDWFCVLITISGIRNTHTAKIHILLHMRERAKHKAKAMQEPESKCLQKQFGTIHYGAA